MRPRSTSLKRAITTARAMPNTVPMAKPTSARRNENHVADSTTRQLARSLPRRSGSPKRESMSHTWGIDVSWPAAGSGRRARVPPSAGPISLYSSHAAATSTSDRANIPTVRSRAATAAHCLASRVAVSAGMTCSPYACSVASLPSCWR